MQIGLVALMTDGPLVDLLSSMVPILFYRMLANKLLSHGPVLKQNTSP
jgi:hypothetical protein